MKTILFVTLITGLLFTAGTTSAVNYTWSGAVDSNWDTTTANWSGGGTTWVNGLANDAFFNATGAGAVTATVPITALRVRLNVSGYSLSGRTITLQAATRPDGAAGVTNNILVNGFSSMANDITISGASNITGFDLQGTGPASGSLTYTGTMSYSGMFGIMFGGKLIVGTGGSITLAGAGGNAAVWLNGSGGGQTSTLQIDGGTFTVEGNNGLQTGYIGGELIMNSGTASFAGLTAGAGRNLRL